MPKSLRESERVCTYKDLNLVPIVTGVLGISVINKHLTHQEPERKSMQEREGMYVYLCVKEPAPRGVFGVDDSTQSSTPNTRKYLHQIHVHTLSLIYTKYTYIPFRLYTPNTHAYSRIIYAYLV